MSSIEWTQKTWNPLVGCSKVSPGCKNCYAEVMANRLKAMGQIKYREATNEKGKWSRRIDFWADALHLPTETRKPTTWFVNSMSDLFHPFVRDEWLESIWQVMADNPRHTFQVLTKRATLMEIRARKMSRIFGVLPNVWLGVSVENQNRANERIPRLRDTPAAIRFLSMEPLLEAVNIRRWLWEEAGPDWAGSNPRPGISWVIIGGESGPGARPFHLEWAGKIVEDCQEANVPVFVKQVGASPYWWGRPVRENLGRKGNEP
jgi:protein gp37